MRTSRFRLQYFNELTADLRRLGQPYRLFCILLALAVSIAVPSSHANEAAPRSGVATGALTAKGEGWIAVRADGAQESTKLIPRWIGGLPKNGGGFDKKMLAVFRELVVGSRLKVAWIYDEHLRAVDIEVLPAQEEGDGNDNDNGGDGGNGASAENQE